tara:strand:+ start:43 stop:309 length:267 start_codon:yes stop_codon:yes gene_type:complete
MNINTYEDSEADADIDTDIDIDIDENLLFSSGIAGFEIAYGTTNKEMIRKNVKKKAKQKYHIRQKLDSLHEKRTIEKELNSFSDYWDN